MEGGGYRRRGYGAQLARREAEREVRKGAVACASWAAQMGVARAEIARRLGMQGRTLTGWVKSWGTDRMKIKALGRSAERMDRETRDTLIAIFQLMGPGVGVPLLQTIFPEVARRELEEMVVRVRRVWRKKGWTLIHVLRWTQPGYVWAMDFTQPPSPVDGIYPYVLVVRDLGSGEQLEALPTMDMKNKTVRDALAMLFRRYGRPLVLKSDNGSGFTDDETRALLSTERVWLLLSPPRLPKYNGAAEAGIGSIKTRAHHESARNDRPGEWTCDDVEGARQQANQMARPFGLIGPTPDDVWQYHAIPGDPERSAFADMVHRYQDEMWQEQGYLPGVELSRAQQDSLDRVSISRALIESGYLVIRRRRIPLPIWRAKLKDIS
jgi:transposase InsO family protein